MSEINDGTPHEEIQPRPIIVEYLAFASRKVSWVQAYNRLVMGYSPVGTTINVSPSDPETEARLQRTTPIIPPL